LKRGVSEILPPSIIGVPMGLVKITTGGICVLGKYQIGNKDSSKK